MTIATSVNKVIAQGNGATTAFSFSFLLPAAANAVVTVTDALGNQTILANTQYSLSGVGNPNGGTLNYPLTGSPLAAGSSISLQRVLPLQQLTSLINQAGYFPSVVEGALDSLEMQIQQIAAVTGGNTSLQFPPSDPLTLNAILPAAAARANNLLSFDSLGNVITVAAAAQSATALTADLLSTSVSTKGSGQIGFLYSLGYSAGTIGRWLQDLATSAGSTLIGFLQTGTGAILRTLADKLFETVSVMDFIPASEHAAIRAYTSTLDVSSYVNAAIAAGAAASARVRAPAGGYFGLFPTNLSARRTGLTGRGLIGDGADRTQFNWYTGNFPCVDATGQNTSVLTGINFRSDNPGAFGLPASACASIGLMMGRGNLTQSCNQLATEDLRFNLTSDMTRNAGNGTIGILNNGAEHVIRNEIQIYANLPVCDHNGLQFTPSFSSNIPTIGANYEQPYLGAAISCTIHESRNMQLVCWDSFRAIWLHQVASSEWPNLYTSTRKLVSALPAFKETFNLSGSCANVKAHGYQEVSGLFGATYRMDHRYLTYDGLNENIDIVIQRGALDMGFTLPGSPEPSVMALNGGLLANSRINCNYLDGIYAASGDNNGFAALPVAITGTPGGFRNVDFVLDHSGSHSAAIFSVIGPFCTNVKSTNYRSGDTRRGDSVGGGVANTFVPVAVGLSSAGVATYTFRSGLFERSGGWCYFTLTMTWTAHTGTGGLAIQGLPYLADVNQNQMVPVYFDGLVVDAGVYQCVGWIANNSSQIQIRKCNVAGAAALQVQVDATVSELTITGCYKVAD